MDAFVTMNLSYNEEITPPDYEPPNFRAINDKERVWIPSNKQGQLENFNLGELSTSHHRYCFFSLPLVNLPLIQG